MQKENQHINFSPLPEGKKVKRILVVRLQATGDVVIMLPYIQYLRKVLPGDVSIDLIVREECKDIPRHLTIFSNIYVLGGGRNTKLQLVSFLLLLPKLLFRKYDVLLDLQNHRLSRVMRKMLGIKTFSVFDRTSSDFAGLRYQNTINVIGLPEVKFEKLSAFYFPDEGKLFKKFGLEQNRNYIVLNPAGAFKNRNWELDNYVELARQWINQIDPEARFLILGIGKIKENAGYFRQELGECIIDLVGKTTQIEAMLLLKKAQMVISEDSGLMHMSYVVGTPTVGILGSTRNDWTDPNLPHTRFFHSADLPCGNCMRETCIHKETLCLIRIKPSDVMRSAMDLLNSEVNLRSLS